MPPIPLIMMGATGDATYECPKRCGVATYGLLREGYEKKQGEPQGRQETTGGSSVPSKAR